MAIAPVQKIQLAVAKSHKKKFLELLQDFGSFQVDDFSEQLPSTDNEALKENQHAELNFANIEFAIKILTPHAKKRGLLEGPIVLSDEEIAEKAKNFDYDAIVKKCYEIEGQITTAKNELTAANNELATYKPWEKLKAGLQNLKGTKTTGVILGALKTQVAENAILEIENVSPLTSVEKVKEEAVNSYLIIVFDKEVEKDIRKTLSEFKFAETEAPAEHGPIKDYINKIEENIEKNESNLKKADEELKKLALHMDDLKAVHDYMGWQKEKIEAIQKFGNTQKVFIISGWIETKKRPQLEEALNNETNEFSIMEIQPDEGEAPPVIIKNSNFTSPFETLTFMYGLPKHDEMDPTPYLSIFFVVFFALCLTDAAYGIVLFACTALALKFMKMGDGMKRLVKLLMYCGITTAVIGAIFGGWFGLEAKNMPDFMTYTAANGEKMFFLQQINAVTNPLAVLILALGLGFLQIVVGVYMKFIHNFRHGSKKDAIMDTGTWAFMLTGIGFYILAAAGLLPGLAELAKWWVLIAAVGLILTQGRDKKNIIARLLSGVLSLYGLVGYMSDVLSYSRLLALGLATTIIGLAVNVITGLAGNLPYIGWIFAIVIFIGGHIFNLVINTLGSFIHAGRLQFVEFFSKFMEGGGKEFKPLTKKNKYVFIKNN
ncbi:V-type ATP synthase subunit I [Patescibacteria group bacterium]|nr:V-type ATP synthase subunit I [Patescibacteria group bacterium]MBU1702882.1 V-type ATP synthase subunit I [Patescibacteria group bacterium]MBU1953361.1 V-type ATP synthase subunit I [Patescibacteria group bacterium]